MIEQQGTIPIIVLTGFLGSGKTSLLRKLIDLPELADTAVLINEFGEVGLDHMLVDAIDEDVILLESGCVCCNVRDDFCTALLDLYAKREQQVIPPFHRVVLETTGVADPLAIHQVLINDQDIKKSYRFSKVITVVDGVYGLQTLEQYTEAQHQVAIADSLVMAKMDIAESSTCEELVKALQAINPNADVLRVGKSDPVNISLLLLPDSDDHSNHRHQDYPQLNHDKNHSTRFSTFTLTWTDAVPWSDFVAWLEGLLLVRGDSILRLKGLLHVMGQDLPTVIQGVQHSFYPPERLDKWPSQPPRTELTFITCDFSKTAAINSFQHILDIQPAPSNSYD